MSREVLLGSGSEVAAPRSRSILVLCSFSSFVNGIFLNVRGPIIGTLSESLGSTPSSISLFLLLSGIGGILGALPTGKIIDLFRSPLVVAVAGMVVRLVSCLVLPYASSIMALSCVGAVQGISLPVVGISLRTLIVWTYRENSASYLNLMMAFFGLGSCIAPFFVAGASTLVSRYRTTAPSTSQHAHLTVQVVFFGLAFLCLLAISLNLLVYGMLSCASPALPKKQTHAVRKSFDDRSEGATVKRVQYGGRNSLSCFSRPWAFFTVVNLYIVFTVGVEGVVGNWLYTLAGGSPKSPLMSTAMLSSSALWASFTISRLIMIKLSGTVPLRWILYGSHAMSFLSLLPLLTIYMLRGQITPSAIWGLSIFFGAGIAPSFPNFLGLSRKLSSIEFSGLAQALIALSANAGNGALPAIAGLLSQPFGPEAFVVVPLLGLATMQILLLLLIRLAERSQPEPESLDSPAL